MPRTRLKSPTMGIEPPSPIASAFLPHSAASAARVLASAGLSKGRSVAAALAKLLNSTLASAGKRARTKLWKAARISCGSCAPTSRNDTFAVAWAGMTVFAPSPV